MTKHSVSSATQLFASILLLVSPSDAGISGRIVVQGPVPAPTQLPPGRDTCCQAAAPVDESLLVDPDGGLANVLVSVEPRRGEAKPPAGPVGTEPPILTNRGCAFSPRVVVARVDQPLILANADPTMHNVDIEFVRNSLVNVVVEPDGRRELPLAKRERKPVAVRCNVHTFMKAWVAVREDEHAAVTDANGRFDLPRLPSGTWRLRFYHEGKPLAGLLIGETPTDERGEWVATVPDGGVELGDLTVPAESLLPPP